MEIILAYSIILGSWWNGSQSNTCKRLFTPYYCLLEFTGKETKHKRTSPSKKNSKFKMSLTSSKYAREADSATVNKTKRGTSSRRYWLKTRLKSMIYIQDQDNYYLEKEWQLSMVPHFLLYHIIRSIQKRIQKSYRTCTWIH